MLYLYPVDEIVKKSSQLLVYLHPAEQQRKFFIVIDILHPMDIIVKSL